MGVVTGKGLADLIRENLGVRITFWSMLLLLIANAATTVAEFAGVSSSMSIFGVSPLISVPLAAILVWVLVVRGSYRYVERILWVVPDLLQYVFTITYHPNWGQVLHETLIPPIQFNRAYLDPGCCDRYYDRPMDSVLPAIRYRGQGNQNCSSAFRTHRYLCRSVSDGLHRILHRRMHRGNVVCLSYPDELGLGCCFSTGATCARQWAPCRNPVWCRAAQRLADGRQCFAAFNRVLGIGGFWLGAWYRAQIQGSATVLLFVYPGHSARCGYYLVCA